jgi:hypothetical protein
LKWWQIETRLRRALRDPEGTLYTSEELQRHWNDTQNDLQQKTHLLEHVEAHRYPPLYDWAITHWWERSGVQGDVFHALTEWLGQDARVCYPWEPGYVTEDSNPPDCGDRWTHAWEILHCTTADHVPIPLHAQFETMKFCAYDREEIRPITEHELAKSDYGYRTATGYVVHYWRPDNFHNQIVLYPHPSSPVIQDLPEPHEQLVAATGEAGIISSDDEHLDTGDTGLMTDVIELDDALFCVYEPIPVPVEDQQSVPDWPDWQCRFVEYGVLARAFGADRDSFQPSLRDYWQTRYDIGIEGLRRFKRGRLKDRTFIIGGDIWGKTQRSRVRFPAGYPATWP